MKTTKTHKFDKALEAIAREHLGIQTLATRRSDSLDFHEVAVWSLKDALAAAYRAGMRQGAEIGVDVGFDAAKE